MWKTGRSPIFEHPAAIKNLRVHPLSPSMTSYLERYLKSSTIIGDEPTQLADSARYLGLHLDSELNCKIHIQKRREELKIKITGNALDAPS